MWKRFAVSTAVLLSLTCATAIQAQESDATSEWTDARKQPVFGFWVAVKTIIDGGTPRPEDSIYVEDGERIRELVATASANWGGFRGLDLPTFPAGQDASILLHFEEQSYELMLALDENNEIGNIKLTNYVPPDQLSQATLADLGDDTLRVSLLTSLLDFRMEFERDTGMVRIVSILSPT